MAAPTAYAEAEKNSETAELNFRGYSWAGEISEDTPDKLVITDNTVISKDTEIKNKNIRVEKKGILEITDGAKISLNKSQIFIENGGTLIISDGALNILQSSSVTNVGTLIIGSKGKLDIKSNGFSSKPGSALICNGKISCVSEKYYNKAIATIQRYDENFNLSDYSMYVYASGSSATIQFKYCIDNIETSYKYTAKISNKDGLKVTRSSIKLSKVYDKTGYINTRLSMIFQAAMIPELKEKAIICTIIPQNRYQLNMCTLNWGLTQMNTLFMILSKQLV